ncbi:unnamed protein product, partial [Phaeothamnion confervicola]
ASAAPELEIPDHDMAFWFGDLNYRIDVEVPTDTVFEKVKGHDHRYLLDRDQLKLARRAGDAFGGFSEADIAFAPTYKYIPGTDAFDTQQVTSLHTTSTSGAAAAADAADAADTATSRHHYASLSLIQDKKPRAPAWCDRVLWRCAKDAALGVTALTYGRAELRLSDHKPVYAQFQARL